MLRRTSHKTPTNAYLMCLCNVKTSTICVGIHKVWGIRFVFISFIRIRFREQSNLFSSHRQFSSPNACVLCVLVGVCTLTVYIQTIFRQTPRDSSSKESAFSTGVCTNVYKWWNHFNGTNIHVINCNFAFLFPHFFLSPLCAFFFLSRVFFCCCWKLIFLLDWSDKSNSEVYQVQSLIFCLFCIFIRSEWEWIARDTVAAFSKQRKWRWNKNVQTQMYSWKYARAHKNQQACASLNITSKEKKKRTQENVIMRKMVF